jgi:hypothetical protein
MAFWVISEQIDTEGLIQFDCAHVPQQYPG